MSKSSPSLTVPPAVLAIQSRFQIWHGAALQSAAHLKLAKYFCGLEVSALAAACEAAPGRKAGDAAPTFERVVEDAFKVSARTARRYRVFFDTVTQERPEVADALNGLWRKFSGEGKGKAKPLALPSSEKATALVAETLSAETLLKLCHAADEMGLCELFEEPAKDAGGDADNDGKGGGNRKAAREKLLRFWGRDVFAGLQRREFLRLPLDVRKTLAHEMETALKQLKPTLTGGKK
jgi:hypothetical protein